MSASDPAPRPLPPKPVPPADSDCCLSGCVLCVFTIYERELELWREQVAALRAAGDTG